MPCLVDVIDVLTNNPGTENFEIFTTLHMPESCGKSRLRV